MGVVATGTERSNSHGIISSLSSRSSLCPEGLQVRITLTDDNLRKLPLSVLFSKRWLALVGRVTEKTLVILTVSKKLSVDAELHS